MESGLGGIFWPKGASGRHLEQPEKVVFLPERARKRVKEWHDATFMKEEVKALDERRILAPTDLKNLVSFPRYGRLNEKCRDKTLSNSKCFLLFIALPESYLTKQLYWSSTVMVQWWYKLRWEQSVLRIGAGGGDSPPVTNSSRRKIKASE